MDSSIPGLVIDFSPEGQAQSLHMDKFSLDFLGPMSIDRATDIRFEESTQRWDIHYHHGEGRYETTEELKSFANYEEARQCEVEWLNICRGQNRDPMSYSGLALMNIIRGRLTVKKLDELIKTY